MSIITYCKFDPSSFGTVTLNPEMLNAFIDAVSEKIVPPPAEFFASVVSQTDDGEPVHAWEAAVGNIISGGPEAMAEFVAVVIREAVGKAIRCFVEDFVIPQLGVRAKLTAVDTDELVAAVSAGKSTVTINGMEAEIPEILRNAVLGGIRKAAESEVMQ